MVFFIKKDSFISENMIIGYLAMLDDFRFGNHFRFFCFFVSLLLSDTKNTY